jgi:hypothetical protein
LIFTKRFIEEPQENEEIGEIEDVIGSNEETYGTGDEC